MISILFLTTFIPKTLVVVLLNNIIFYLLAKKKLKKLIWMYAACCIVIVNLPKLTDFHSYLIDKQNFTNMQIYQSIVIIAWHMNKCISFTLDKIANSTDDDPDFSFINFLGYTLHFPTVYLGPIIIYDRYRVILTESSDGFVKRFMHFIIDIIKVIFWMMFIDFALHFIYIYCLQNNSKVSDLYTFTKKF